MSTPTVFELFAIKYAELDRSSRENFVFQDIHDGPMPLDYFVWVAKSPERTFVIDIGFDETTASRRNRAILRTPSAGLAMLGIDTASVEHVVVTHLPVASGTFLKRPFIFKIGR